MRTFRRVTVNYEAGSMTNGDTPQHGAQETGQQNIQGSFNVDNLAQKGAPTYVAFKSSEEYVENTCTVEDTSQNNESGKMSKLKSLFSKSNPDLSKKQADTKTSIKKWFSFSKFEDISKSNQEGTQTNHSLQDPKESVELVNSIHDNKEVEILHNEDKIGKAVTFHESMEEITKNTLDTNLKTNLKVSKEEILDKEEENTKEKMMKINFDDSFLNVTERNHENIENEAHQTTFNEINDYSDIQVNIPVMTEEDQDRSSETEGKSLNIKKGEGEIVSDDSDKEVEAFANEERTEISNSNLEEITKDTLDISLVMSKEDILNELEDNTKNIIMKMIFEDAANHEYNEYEELHSTIDEVYSKEETFETEENSLEKKECLDEVDEVQIVINPQEEHHSITLHQPINFEERFNPWSNQSLYEIPEENEEETITDNSISPGFGFPALINDETLKSLNDFRGKEENDTCSIGLISQSDSETDEMLNKTYDMFDPWNEMQEMSPKQLDTEKIDSFIDNFPSTEYLEGQKVDDYHTSETEESNDFLISDILDHIITNIIVLKEGQCLPIDPFTDQNSINLSMDDMDDDGQDGELCDMPKEILSNLTLPEREHVCQRHSQISEINASEEKSEDVVTNEKLCRDQFHENTGKLTDQQDPRKESSLGDKRAPHEQNLEDAGSAEWDSLSDNNLKDDEEDSRQDSYLKNEQDSLEDVELQKNFTVDFDCHTNDIHDIHIGKDILTEYSEGASQEDKVDIQEPLESSDEEEEQIAIASDADDETGNPKDEKKKKTIRKRVKKALSFKGPRKAFQKFLASEDKNAAKTTQKKQKKSNHSEEYDSEFFPPEAREEHKTNLTRSFSLSMLKTQKQLSGLTLKRKFNSLGRGTKPPPPSFFDTNSIDSSLSAPFPPSAPQPELDNIRLKIGRSTFYLLSDEAQTQAPPINKNEPQLSTCSEDVFDLRPLNVKEESSEAGSDCVDSGAPDQLEDTDILGNIRDSESELLSVYSNSDTDYFSIASSESNTNLNSNRIQTQRLTKSLDDISMIGMKKKKFSVSNEFLENPDQIAFHSIGHNGDEVSRNLSSSHPHLYNTSGNSLVIINSNSNKSSWKPFKKLKQIFKSPSKLTEASVYSDTYLQKDPQVNQNPIYIASPEEELQEVTGFPNHQTPFTKQSLGKISEILKSYLLTSFIFSWSST